MASQDLEIYVLTMNEGKLREFRELGKECGIVLKKANIPKVEVQSHSLIDIAVYAATTAVVQLGKPVFAEDAGLFIKALNGFPGPYSSYALKTIGVDGIIKLMTNMRDREAYFLSAIALAIPSCGVKVFTGKVNGSIAREPRGEGGFGFDPIFIPFGESRTFAEMSISEKNRYSHRAKAFRKMAEWLRTAFKPE